MGDILSLISIFPKTSIGSCRKSDNHHLARLLIKSGYILYMNHKSLITLSAYILKTKCRNLAIFFLFSLTLKKHFIFEFLSFHSVFGQNYANKEKGLDT